MDLRRGLTPAILSFGGILRLFDGVTLYQLETQARRTGKASSKIFVPRDYKTPKFWKR